MPTTVLLSTGKKLLVKNVAWGRDFGDEYDHVTANVSPSEKSFPIDVFMTSEVMSLQDPVSGKELEL